MLTKIYLFKYVFLNIYFFTLIPALVGEILSIAKITNARVALQLRILPGSYNIAPETVLTRDQKATVTMDPKIKNEELEWSTKQRGATIPVGLLVKLTTA